MASRHSRPFAARHRSLESGGEEDVVPRSAPRPASSRLAYQRIAEPRGCDNDSEVLRHISIRPDGLHDIGSQRGSLQQLEPATTRVNSERPSTQPVARIRAFVKIGYNDFASLAEFLDQEDLIADSAHLWRQLLCEGVMALRVTVPTEPDPGDYARRCFERAAILKSLFEDTSRGHRRKYVEAMQEEESSFLRNHMTAIDKFQKVAAHQSKIPPNDYEFQFSSLARDNLSDTRFSRTPHEEPDPDDVIDRVTIYGSNTAQPSRTIGPRMSLYDDSTSVNFSSHATARSRAMDNISTSESLQDQFQLRPRGYYILGRVFAVWWHESAGSPLPSLPPPHTFSNNELENDSKSSSISTGRQSERIFSYIRTFVVVRSLHRHCLCLPVMTYGGRGVAKAGLYGIEIQHHAVIFDARGKPRLVDGEPALTTRPIPVDIRKGESLSSASRIRFDSIFTIQFNVKVKDIGLVLKESRPLLLERFRNIIFENDTDLL